MTTILNKIDFIGGLNVNTPNDVFIDIVSSYGLKLRNDKLSDAIYKTKVLTRMFEIPQITISMSGNSPDLNIANAKKIAAFLTPNRIRWSMISLIAAFNHTYSIIKGGEWDMQLKFGYPDNDNTTNLSPSVVYGLLRRYDIIVRPDVDMTEMCDLLSSYVKYCKSPGDLLLKCQRLLGSVNTNSLLSFVHLSKSIELIDKDDNLSDYLQYNAAKLVTLFMRQLTPPEAIAATAKLFRIDLSTVDDPVAEYNSIANGIFPGSDIVKLYSTFGTGVYDLDYVFNPIFPVSYYNGKSLARMLGKYNITASRSNINATYTKLVSMHKSGYFHEGLLPYVKTFFTCIDGDDIRTTQGLSLVTHIKDGVYKLYSSAELVNMFTTYGDFRCGMTDCFTQSEIGTLYILANKIVTRKITVQSIDIPGWSTLRDCIDAVRDSLSRVNLSEYVYGIVGNDKLVIIELLNDLYIMSLYMRGWDGKSRHPIEEKDIPVNYDNDQVEIFTTTEMSNIRSKCNALVESGENIGSIFLNLPLVKLYNGEYLKSIDSEQGYTILDRMEIVRKKETTWSCIRMSSNWFLITSAYYTNLLRGNVINVSKMHTIG